jgi:hypothetical protein
MGLIFRVGRSRNGQPGKESLMTVFTSCPWCDDEQSLDPVAADEFICQSCGTSVLLMDEEDGTALELAA